MNKWLAIGVSLLSTMMLAPTCAMPTICVDPLCVTSCELVETRRVSRTTFDFVYDVTVSNSSTRVALGVVSEPISNDAATEVTTGSIEFGSVEAGASVTRAGALTLRQDRSEPFDPMGLRWNIEGRTETNLGLAWEGSPVDSAVLDTSTDDRVGTDEVSMNVLGFDSPRTKLEIAFTPTATFAEVEALLASEGARITSALQAIGIVVIRVPDPGTTEAFESLRSRLLASPHVRAVRRLDFLKPAALGDGLNSDNFPAQGIQHSTHHVPPAWNARAVMTTPPSFVVPDYFGQGPPSADVDAVIPFPEDFLNAPSALSEDGHGYAVLGPLLGAYEDGGLLDVNRITVKGALSVQAPGLRVFDLEGGQSLVDDATFENETLGRARDLPGNVVINLSLGELGVCTVPCPDELVENATIFAEKVRGLGLENRALIAFAAGNDSVFAPAVEPLAIASLGLPGLAIESPLANMLVVEAIVAYPNPPNVPECLADFSSYGGNLSFVGKQVWSFIGPVFGAEFSEGTSLATPGAASVAAMIWAVRPELTAPQIVNLLIETGDTVPSFSFSSDCANIQASPYVNAYRALLSTDILGGTTGQNPDAPVRLAILDVDEDGDFDGDDVETFVRKIYEIHVAVGNERDYSRFDLNGDDFTSPASRTRFDLDAVASTHLLRPEYETLTVEFPNGETEEFDESSVTDLDALCYYTQTPLYEGLTSELEGIEGFSCLPGSSDDGFSCPAGTIGNPCTGSGCCAWGTDGCDCY